MENVIELKTQRQKQTDSAAPSRDEDVLKSMYVGAAMSKWGSLENLATEVANRAPMEYLKILARVAEKD